MSNKIFLLLLVFVCQMVYFVKSGQTDEYEHPDLKLYDFETTDVIDISTTAISPHHHHDDSISDIIDDLDEPEWIAVGVGIILLILCCIVSLCYYCRYRKRQNTRQIQSSYQYYNDV